MKAVSIACLAGASLFIAATAFAADLGSEITNAATHAGLAAKAADSTACICICITPSTAWWDPEATASTPSR